MRPTVEPRLPLLKIGRGKKLHIPHGGRPLCEAMVVNRKGNPLVVDVLADGATCSNCLKQAEIIQRYI